MTLPVAPAAVNAPRPSPGPSAAPSAPTTGPARVDAAHLRAGGFALCKPDPDTKSPTYAGWSTRSLEPQGFGPDDLIGIMGGPLSDGNREGHALVILDLDHQTAVKKADDFLPPTGMEEGRPGKSRDHRYYLVPLDTIPERAWSQAAQASAAAKAAKGHPGPFKRGFNHAQKKERLIDFIGTGGQVVCPSPGNQRQWVRGVPGAPAVVPFPVLWDATCRLAEACGAKLERPPDPGRPRQPQAGGASTDLVRRAVAYLATIDPAVSGQDGHGDTYWPARVVCWGFGLGEELGFQLLREHFNPRCNPPWTEKELRHKCHDADTLPFGKPRGWLRDAPLLLRDSAHAGEVPPQLGDESAPGAAGEAPTRVAASPGLAESVKFTDLGNARRMAAYCGANLRHCFPWRKDLVWDRRLWQVDNTGQVERWGKDTVRQMYAEAAKEPDETRRTATIAHAVKSEDARRIRNMVTLVRSEPGIPILPERLDGDPMALNVTNGTVDLRTGKLRPHRREDYFTKLCRVEYHPHAPCELWERFLAQIFPAAGDAAEHAGDEALIRFVKRFLGYCLTGDVSEQLLALFWGTGANGKSTLLNVLLELLGADYAMKAPANLLMARRDSHPTEKADLFGRRLVAAVETEEGGRLDEALVKDLTGGDRIRARRMREDHWEFAPTHKLILCTNHKPRIRGTDHAIWRRIRLVPFTEKFDGNSRDPRLPEKLRAEYPGILAWLVRGCLDWQRHGLGMPEAVKQATQAYRDEQDLVAAFLEECCTVKRGDPSLRCRASELYARFQRWAEASGEAKGSAVPSQRKVGELLTERGFERFTSDGTWYRGIGLRQQPEDMLPD